MTILDRAPAAAPAKPWLRAGAILTVDELVCEFSSRRGTVHAVSGVSFDVLPGETLGLVGESGCGKSTTGRAIMQLPKPSAGAVRYAEQELGALSARGLIGMRARVQMIFQDPISSLNPRRKVAKIVGEGLRIAGAPAPAVRERVERALREVGMDPETVGDRRPGEFSGGQCQRIAIARAMALDPRVLICDEPVSALDVSAQAQVLNILEDMKGAHELAMVFISHDLAVVRNVSDRLAVMYLGKIVEIGDADQIFAAPRHPYTAALMASVPAPDPAARPLVVHIGDTLPSPLNPPSGCRFRTRCPLATEACAATEPVLDAVGDDHFVACHFPLSTAEQRAAIAS